MKPSTGIHLLLLFALCAATVPAAAVAQEPGLPTPLTLADVVRVAGERRDEIDAARARTRAGEARPAIVSALDRHMREGRIRAPEDVDAAVVEGAAARVRPLGMTVATTVLVLLPLLWEAGVGADVTARTAAPVVGGLWSCMLLTLLVLPAAYTIWRRHQVRIATTVSLPHDMATSEGAT